VSLTGTDTDSWLAGRKPAGATYIAGQHVIIRSGPSARRVGIVVMLADLEPEPCYLIEIGAGHYVQVRQSELTHAD
jgi:hypothetical protein